MHELAAVFADRGGLKWIGVTAIVYALILIPFNHLGLEFAGVSIRPAAALPVVFGILWGPAAAWDLGIGNIAGDLFGSWSPMSVFGFLVNVITPYLSYLLWHRVMKSREIRSDRQSLSRYILVSCAVLFSCMAVLAACGTIFFGRPFVAKFISYFGNNVMWALTAGSLLFWLILGPAVRKGLVYGKEWAKANANREW